MRRGRPRRCVWSTSASSSIRRARRSEPWDGARPRGERGAARGDTKGLLYPSAQGSVVNAPRKGRRGPLPGGDPCPRLPAHPEGGGLCLKSRVRQGWGRGEGPRKLRPWPAGGGRPQTSLRDSWTCIPPLPSAAATAAGAGPDPTLQKGLLCLYFVNKSI